MVGPGRGPTKINAKNVYDFFASSSRTNWIDAKELLWFADLLEMADWFTALKLGSGRGLAWYVSAVP